MAIVEKIKAVAEKKGVTMDQGRYGSANSRRVWRQ